MGSKVLSVLSCFVGVCLICDIVNAAPVSTDSDLPANWQQLIGPDALQNKDSHFLAQGETIFEGDIKGVDRKLGATDPNGLANLAHNAVMDRSQLWPGGVVPYSIGSGYNSQQKTVIEGALQDIMDKTCVKFVKRTNERDYITFVNRNAGCSSYVARVGGQQMIDLQEGCIYEYGEVQHETMHALGFFHEQSRKDRDDFVTIVWSNIQRDDYDQFEKYQSNLLGLPYDYDSIMHYGWNYFALNRNKPTIVPKTKASIGNRKIMSPTDVQKINLLYQCSGAKAPSNSGGPSAGSRPTSSGSRGTSGGSRGSSGSSILDILFGGAGAGGGSDDRGQEQSRPQPAAPSRPAPSRPDSSSSSGSHSSLKGALTSFLSGLFGR